MIGNTNLASANYDFLKFFSSFFAVCAILAHELGKSGIGQPYGHFLIAFYHLAARDRLGLTNSVFQSRCWSRVSTRFPDSGGLKI
jgi:hypothetical protein